MRAVGSRAHAMVEVGSRAEMQAAVADIDRVVAHATRENSRRILAAERLRLVELIRAASDQGGAGAASSAPACAAPARPAPKPPSPPPPMSVSKVEAGVAFGKISRYAWDQSAKFVKVYVTVPGVESVADEAISLDVQSNPAAPSEPGAASASSSSSAADADGPPGGRTYSLRFDVLGLPKHAGGASNMRLQLPTLYGAVEAGSCSWARKADSMVVLKLRKAGGEEWASLDDAARAEAARKARRQRENEGKTTAELIQEMYVDADEEGKEGLAKAWEAGRAKREGRRDTRG